MKDKILMLIIGILIGAILASGVFLLFGQNGNEGSRMDRRDFDANMVDGGRRGMSPDGNSTEEPPERPEEANSTVDTTENT